MLSREQIDSATTAVASIPNMDDLSETFYTNLFETAPEVRPMFGDDIKDQAKKLSATLSLAFKNLEKIVTLVPTLKEMGAKHATYGVKPEHYGIVASTLIATVETTLGPKFGSDAKDSFEAILTLVAQVMLEGAADAS